MSKELHHYRKAYKSDHLGVADLEEMIEEGKKLFFTIKEVKQEDKVVAGARSKTGLYNIAYFVEPIKPWVLNAGNAKIIKGFAGNNAFVENWKNIPVELYIDETVKMAGSVVGGVKVRPIQPRTAEKKKPEFTSANFEAAKKASASIEKIKELYTISPEIEREYLAYELPAAQ